MSDLAEQYGIEVGQTYKARKCPFTKARTPYPRTVESISDSGNMVEYRSGNPRWTSKTTARTATKSFADWAGLSKRTETVPHETKKPTVADLPKYRMYCEKCGCEATKYVGLRICTCPDGTGVTKVRITQSLYKMGLNMVAFQERHQELLDLIQAPVKNNPMEEERWERENDRVIWLMADTRRRMAEQKAHMTDPDKRPKPTVASPRPMSALERIQQWPKPEDVPPVSKIMKNSEYGRMNSEESEEIEVEDIEVAPNGHLWDPEAAHEFYNTVSINEAHLHGRQIGMARAYADISRIRQEENLVTVGRLMGLQERIAFSMWREEAIRAGGTKSIVDRRTLFNFMAESKETKEKWNGLARAALDMVRESGLTFQGAPRVENPNELDQGQSTP